MFPIALGTTVGFACFLLPWTRPRDVRQSVRGLVRQHWTARAACREASTEIFFAADEFSIAAARRLCRGCPVRRQCAWYALARPEITGIWGGLTDADRNRIRAMGGTQADPDVIDTGAGPPHQ
jgi:WhiB family redox-sensing transcriptional regulator